MVLVSQVAIKGRLLARRVYREWLRWRSWLPGLLVSFRAALGPVMILLYLVCERVIVGVTCIGLALLSDVFDGILARRWHVDSAALRRWDTRADTFFYACVLAMVWLRHPAALERRSLLIAGLLTAEVLQHAFAAAKYGRHASYHSWLSRIWGLMMASAMIALLGWNLDNWFLDLTIGWGILCNVQGLAMSFILPEWQRDVPTLFHAVKIRRKLLA